MNKVWELLQKAADMIADPEDWTQGSEYDHSPEGRTRHCAMGAVIECATTMDNPRLIHDANNLLNEVSFELFPGLIVSDQFGSIVRVNDDLGHEAVMQVFEKAIVRAQEQVT
jgi:hypothetical protein